MIITETRPGRNNGTGEENGAKRPQIISAHVSTGILSYDASRKTATLTALDEKTTQVVLTKTGGDLFAQLLGDVSGVHIADKTAVSRLREKFPQVPIYTIHEKGYSLTSNEDVIKAYLNNPEYHNGKPLPEYIKRHTTSHEDLVLFINRNIAISPFIKDKPFVELEPASTALLSKLMEDPFRIYSHYELAKAHIAPDLQPLESDVKYVRQPIRRLRKALGESRNTPHLIYAMPGMGYSLTPDGVTPTFNPFTKEKL